MRIFRTLLWAACFASVLAGCGSGSSSPGASVNNSGARGTLIQDPPLRIASLTATDFTAQLNATPAGQQLLQIASSGTMSLPCGVDFHYIQYSTVGGATPPEQTTASGALMVPTGSAAQCSGARPIVLYAHGTSTVKTYNIAAISDSTNDAYNESALIAAMFAAQGYIVVAPNYAGYDSSTLPYHPYLNASQQSKDMIDALTAARSALGHIFATATDNGKLFITGYSQGGHVAMATAQELQALGLTVTASAPMSGPYAMAAFGDAVFFGNVNLGSTVFSPMLTESYQRAYGNIYSATTDVFSSTYATGIDTLLPSATPLATLFQQNKLPETALFNSVPPTTGGANPALDALFATITPPTTPAAQAPLFALGFAASNYLITDAYRLAYVADALTNPDGVVPAATTGLPAAAPANTLRQAFKLNDLRGFGPTAPMLLCGGGNDPTVYYPLNAGVMATLLAAQVSAGLVTVVDVDPATSPTPTGAIQTNFGAAETAVSTAAYNAAIAAGASTSAATGAAQGAVVQDYHGTLVPPFCTAAARGFFSNFQ
jgi:acetyl esterase/lipase